MRRFLAEITYVDGSTESFAYEVLDAESKSSVTFRNCVPVSERLNEDQGRRIIIQNGQIRRFAMFSYGAPPAPDSGDGHDHEEDESQ